MQYFSILSQHLEVFYIATGQINRVKENPVTAILYQEIALFTMDRAGVNSEYRTKKYSIQARVNMR